MTLLLKRLPGFFALGAGLLLANFWWQGSGEPDPIDNPAYQLIHITPTQLQLAEESWRARWGRAPSEQDMAAILRNETDEEVLFREALRAGLHKTDPVVRRRLWQNMQFLELDTPAESGAELLERAYELGMHTSDIVVRRRLVQRFQRNMLDTASPEEPSREQLAAFIEANRSTFQTVPSISFVQIYLNDDTDGDIPDRARELLARLQREFSDPGAVAGLGDPLPVQREFDGVAMVDVGKRFGGAFAAGLAEAPEGSWSGPYPSVLGWHIVWVRDYQPAHIVLDEATLAKARGQLIDRRKDAMVRSAVARLRQRYEITIGSMAPVDDSAEQEG